MYCVEDIQTLKANWYFCCSAIENHVPQAVCRVQSASTIWEKGIDVGSIVWSKFQRENWNHTRDAKRFSKQKNLHPLILLQRLFLSEMISPASAFDDSVSQLSRADAAGGAGTGSCSQAPAGLQRPLPSCPPKQQGQCQIPTCQRQRGKRYFFSFDTWFAH